MGNVFDKEGNELKTPVTFHPGELLLEEIEERKLKKTDFAKSIGLLPGNLSELFKGKRHINARLAVRLEKP
jgi:plasmid maintenance system antidote protein VapI